MAANGTSRGSLRPHNASRSPSFVIIGLLVVIAIIGFNYWNVSTRNNELRNTVLDMTDRLRLAGVKRLSIEKRNDALAEQLKQSRTDTEAQKSDISNKEQELNKIKDELDAKTKELQRVQEQDLANCHSALASAKANVTLLQGSLITERETSQRLQTEVNDINTQRSSGLLCKPDVERQRLGVLQQIQQVLGQSSMLQLQQNGVDLAGITLNQASQLNQLNQGAQGQAQTSLDFNQINQYPNVITNGSLNASDPLQSRGYPSDGFAQVGVNGSFALQQPGLTGQLPYDQGTGQFGVGGVDPIQQQYPGDMGQQPLQPGFVAGGDMGAIQQPSLVAGGDVGAIQQPGLPPSGDNLQQQQQVDLNSLQIPAETQQALGIQGDGTVVVGGDNALNGLPQPPNAPLAELRNPAMADPNYGEINSTASEGFDYGTNEDDVDKDSNDITGVGQAFNVVDRVNREAPSGEGFNDSGTALNMVTAGTSDIAPPSGVEGEAPPAADDGSNPLKQMMEKWISTNEAAASVGTDGALPGAPLQQSEGNADQLKFQGAENVQQQETNIDGAQNVQNPAPVVQNNDST